MDIAASLLIPFLITILPVLLLLVSMSFDKVQASSFLAASAGVLSVLAGLITPIVATLLSATLLAKGIPGDEPKCVLGAAIFLPIGYLMTLITFLSAIFLIIMGYLKRKATHLYT